MSSTNESEPMMARPGRHPGQAPLERLLLELAQAKTELEENRLRTDAMLDSLGEGLIVTDARGIITTVNQYALHALELNDAAEVIGSWFPQVIVAVDQYERPIDPLGRPIIRAFASGRAISDHLLYRKKSGKVMPVFVTVAPILLEGKPIGAVEVFRDLTQEHQLDIAKEEFVSLASHQLRTPATGVMTILSMLEQEDFGPLTDLQHRYLRKAIETNNYQLQIIEDLLNAARIDAGKMSLDLQPTNLSDVLHDVVRDQATITHARRQIVTLQAPHHVSTLLDAPKVRMALNNLLSNASKYSPKGSRITLRLRTTDKEAILAVTDRGIGIPASEIPRLFAKFSRLDSKLSASVGGTGLGLFLVKSLIELHQGSVEVASRVGTGSTFTIHLPLNHQRAQ